MDKILELNITEASEMFTILSRNYSDLNQEQKELFKKIYEAMKEHFANKLN